VAIALFILASTAAALGMRMIGIRLLPKRKGKHENHNLFREVLRLLIASICAWVVYVLAPAERSFTFAVIVGSFVGAFLTFSE